MKVVFSPHCDDAYLSLGGSILNWRKAGEPLMIVNCFSKSGASRQVTATTGRVVELVSHTRRLEESVNALTVGAEVEFLGLPEALLRGHRNPIGKTSRSLLNMFPAKIDESGLVKTLQEAVSKLSLNNELYFPLGIGNHHDHRLLSKVGKEAEKGPRGSVSFYEDMPYAAKEDGEQAGIVNMSPSLNKISWPEKVNLLNVYQSQFPGKYGRRILKMIEDYQTTLGGCERIWTSA